MYLICLHQIKIPLINKGQAPKTKAISQQCNKKYNFMQYRVFQELCSPYQIFLKSQFLRDIAALACYDIKYRTSYMGVPHKLCCYLLSGGIQICICFVRLALFIRYDDYRQFLHFRLFSFILTVIFSPTFLFLIHPFIRLKNFISTALTAESILTFIKKGWQCYGFV